LAARGAPGPDGISPVPTLARNRGSVSLLDTTEGFSFSGRNKLFAMLLALRNSLFSASQYT